MYVIRMEKYRLCTTISLKHWEILKRYVQTYETQQKVLEHALECLDNDSRPGAAPPDASSRAMTERSAGPVQKYALMMLLDTIDLDKIREYISRVKPTVYALEYYYHKPLNECTLKEIMDGLVVTSRAIGWYDTVDYEDNGDHYTLKITHSLGPNGSKVARMATEIIFDTYGPGSDTVVSEKGIVQTVKKI
jgi:hypothetical protein